MKSILGFIFAAIMYLLTLVFRFQMQKYDHAIRLQKDPNASFDMFMLKGALPTFRDYQKGVPKEYVKKFNKYCRFYWYTIGTVVLACIIALI